MRLVRTMVIAMKIIMPGQELMIISQEGVMIRVKSTDISLQGRATQGVRVMNVSDSDRVTAVARVATSRKKQKSTLTEEENETSKNDSNVSDEVNGVLSGQAQLQVAIAEEEIEDDSSLDDIEDGDDVLDEEIYDEEGEE